MNIILNILTHGDETIGLKVVKEISKLNLNKRSLKIQIANKKAAQLHKRFIDQDLNRSFPGRLKGNHEQRLANKLNPIIKSADLVIDIHSTTSGLRDAVIVTKLNLKTIKYLEAIRPKYVLIMRATKNNALISSAKIGIAFEYGQDKNPNTVKKTILGVKRVLQQAGLLNLSFSSNRVISPIKYFEVMAAMPRPKGYKALKGINNYQLVKKGTILATNGKNNLIAEQDFYPILFGEKKYKDIFGFMGKIIDNKFLEALK